MILRAPLLSPLLPLFRRSVQPHGISVAGRILVINIISLLLVVSGLFTFGHYMDRLIESEETILQRQASLIAGTLGEVAVENTPEGDILRTDVTRQIIRRLVETTDARTQVFSPSMLLVADSRLLRGAGRYVQVEQLPPPAQKLPMSSLDKIVRFFDWLAMLLPYGGNMPYYVESALPTAEQLPDVAEALKGGYRRTLWSTRDGKLVMTVSVPVQRLRQVVGAVMLTRDGNGISDQMRRIRSDLLQIVSIVMGASALLSLYMAQTIARPLRRLAKSARSARAITSGKPDIPDYTGRGDEIGDLSGTLRSMVNALWQRLDATERFAADVAHELKNPLSSMRSALETLERVEDNTLREKLTHILVEDVVRMERLSTDISATARLEGELSRVKPECIDLANFLGTMSEARAQSGIPIVFDSPEADLLINGNPAQLMQVFENLIGNALSFSPPGKPVTLAAIGTTHQVIVTVEDEGPGIPPGKEEKIFERFYSERPQREKFGTHSGLGLSICRQIIEAHGGHIHAENRTDATGRIGGARFVVELPRMPDNS